MSASAFKYFGTRECRFLMLVIAAFALQWAWQTCGLYHTDSLGGESLSTSPWYLHNLLGCMVYFVTSFFAPKLQRLLTGRAITVVAATCLILTTVLRALPSTGSAAGALVPWTSGFLAAVGGGLFTIVRFDLLCRLSTGREQAAVVLLGTIIQLLCSLLIKSLPSILAVVVQAIIPIALVIVMIRANEWVPPVPPASLPATTAAPSVSPADKPPLPTAQLLAFFILAIALNFIRAAVEGPSSASDSGEPVTIGLVVFITALVLATELALREKTAALVAPFSTVALMTIAVVLLMAGTPVSYSSAFSSAGFYLFVAMFWETTARYAVGHPTGTASVTARTHAIYTLGLLLGTWLFRATGLVAGGETSIPLLAVADLSMVAAFILYGKDGVRPKPAPRVEPSGPGLIGILKADCGRLADTYGLTGREEDVIVDMAAGMSLKAVASARGVSENTVKTHVSHAYRKLAVHSREELMRLVCQTDDERLKEIGRTAE